MNKWRHASSHPDTSSPDGASAAHLAAFRSEESVRRVDPLHSEALAAALALEAQRRTLAQRAGFVQRAFGWITDAPRPALLGAALSFGLLFSTLPLSTTPADDAAMQRSEAPMVGVESPSYGNTESLPADDLLTGTSPVQQVAVPWVTLLGAAGLAVSLLVVVRAGRRRRI